MRKDSEPNLSEVMSVSETDGKTIAHAKTGGFPVPRDMFTLSLGLLRAALPKNYGVSISSEISKALDDTGQLNVTKLSPELINLGVAFSEYDRMVSSKQPLGREKLITKEMDHNRQAEGVLIPAVEIAGYSFRDRIRFYRNRLGISQKAFAQNVGLTPVHFNKIENGSRPVPRLKKVMLIAKELRLSETETKAFLESAIKAFSS